MNWGKSSNKRSRERELFFFIIISYIYFVINLISNFKFLRLYVPLVFTQTKPKVGIYKRKQKCKKKERKQAHDKESDQENDQGKEKVFRLKNSNQF